MLHGIEDAVGAVAGNPAVVAVLQERGLSTEGEHPKLLTFDGVREADVVITMGCGEACPAPGPGKRLEDWELEDPKGKDIETVRRIVDDVDARVRTLLDELGVPVAGSAGPPVAGERT